MKILLAAALAAASTAAYAQAVDPALLERAKSEGRVAYYANITAIEPIMKAFGADTGIKGEYTRISTTKFVATAITEFEAGRFMADVVQGPLPVLEILKDKGMLASYSSKVTAGYPEWTRKDGIIQLFLQARSTQGELFAVQTNVIVNSSGGGRLDRKGDNPLRT